MSKRKLFLFPGAAALVVFGLLFLCARDAVGAELTGPGAAWARTVAMHAPGPAGAPITVSFDPCPGLAAGGCWTPWNSTIYVSSEYDGRFVFAHELGHAFDVRNLSGRERAWFLAAFGYGQTQEWAPQRPADDPYCARISCPVEVFANAYAICALGLRVEAYMRDGTILFQGRREGYYYAQTDMTATARSRARVCRAITTFKDPT